MAGAASVKLPAREGAPSTTVVYVGEGDPIAVRSYTLNDDCELTPRKFGCIAGITREVAKRAGGESVVRTLPREDAAATLDGAYFSNAERGHRRPPCRSPSQGASGTGPATPNQ